MFCRWGTGHLPALTMVAFFSRVADIACGEVVPFGEPFQVIQPADGHTSLVPVPEALKRLAGHDTSIALLSVVGPYHSGKSFLLNSLMGNAKAFSIGRHTSPETMGIWICRTEMKAHDGSEVWLLDSEGFFGPHVAEGYDAKIFTVASLLGAHLVYNTVKIIDQQAVSLLEMLAQRAQLFRTRTSAEAANLEAPEFLSIRSFPPVTWVVEDFVQELPHEHRGATDGATAWLRSYLSQFNDTHAAHAVVEDDGSDRHTLSRLYKDLRVHTLFLPATQKDHLQDLSRLSWNELTEEFREELTKLKSNLFERLEARRFEGRPMTGKTLERALRFIVQGLRRGMFHELPSLWKTWTTQVAEMSLQDADTWFASLLNNIDSGENPVPVGQLTDEVEAARARSVLFYRELLHDFEVRPSITELENRMAVHFETKLHRYHERVQQWVASMSAQAKDAVSRLFAAFELPMDPDSLRRQCEEVSKSTVKDLSAKVTAFAIRGSRVKHGKPATMPVFDQEPAQRLNNDLKTLQGMRELENEREIVQHFKVAVTAADEAVERELKLQTNALYSKSRMKELQRDVSIKCWQAFDENLKRYKWMKNLPHYKTHKDQVQTDAYESRMKRFSAANDQRLQAYYRSALDRCTTAYKTRKQSIQMPADERDLDAEHGRLASLSQDMLVEQGRDLADTDAYRGALRSLNSVLEEGYQHVRQKNVELWKVHSDEATRCALSKNQAEQRRCGLACLFNKVPAVHKSISRKHLVSCFPRSGTGARMSVSMQEKVFEDWYSKDLAHDADTVWNHFYLMSAVVGILGIGVASWSGFCICCERRDRHDMPTVGFRQEQQWPSNARPAYGQRYVDTDFKGTYGARQRNLFGNPGY